MVSCNRNEFIQKFLETNAPQVSYSVIIYLFRVNNGNTRTMYEICLRLTIMKQNNVATIALVSLLLTLNRFFLSCSVVNIVDFEKVLTACETMSVEKKAR